MLTIIVLLGLSLTFSINNKITRELEKEIENATSNQLVSCIVFMKQTYPYDAVENLSVQERIITFRNIANRSQQLVLAWLQTMPDKTEIHQRYWVFNGFHIKATSKIIHALTEREDVAWISHNGEVHIIAEPSDAIIPTSRPVEWNIQKVMADSCWNAGFTGQGVIIGMCDTGVDYEHPALAGKWTGYWLDVINGQPLPYDDMSGTWHGTHCMGTILGGDGLGPFSEDIGVAPGAEYVAAKMLNSGGSGTYDQCAQGLQFMADLKDSVDIKAVSNSWGGSNGADTFFYPITRTYVAIGILPIFANGNNGTAPACPGSYSNVIGVGATDINDDIAGFSNPGPAPNIPPFNDPSTWLRDDWNLIKPQISAPGVNIRSAKGDGSGGYHNLNGTSMATPHVCGAVAILCQKNPNLDPFMLYDIFLDNVDEPPQGAPYPNNDYGWGRLNVWQSLNGTPTINQPWISLLQRTITDPPPGGNNNGLLEPGETGEMVVTIKNVGGANAYSTTGVLESYDNYITINDESYLFGNLVPDQTASNSGNPFILLVHNLTPPGHKAKIGLVLHADGDSANFDDTLYYTIQIGTPPPPTVIYEDDFEYGSGIDSFSIYWVPTGNWNWSTQESHSPSHSAYSGAVSDNAYTFTLRNAVDLSGFSNPQLSIWHMYNFDRGIFMDDASILVSTDGGSNWSNLWTYNWIGGNSQPWTEETFNIPAGSNVLIRFNIDGYEFFQDYTDWYIDDFKFFTPTDNEPPYFANTTVWPDTSFVGPFPVQSKITDESGIDVAHLNYRVNAGSWQQLNMTPQGNDIYAATIPAQSLNDTIDYYLWARDRWTDPNSGADPIGAPDDGYYSFRIGVFGVREQSAKTISFMPLSSNPAKGVIKVAFSVPQEMDVNLVVYDVLGRNVRTLLNGKVKAGTHEIRWDRKDDLNRNVAAGIYFLDFSVEGLTTYKKIEKLVLIK